jgi:predicted Zn-dependent protease
MTYGYDQNPRARRGPGGIRLLIGLGIVLFGVISYYMKTQTNPVTGEKQRVSMSVDQEMKLGIEAAPQMAQQMGGAVDPRRDPRAERVAAMGAKLVQQSEAGRSPYAGNFNFFLLADSQTVNAFALPGGQIFITVALYERLENEAQLAGVLGHEIGHVINRHAAEHMAKGQLGQMIVTGVAVGASDQGRQGQFAAMAAMMANQMLQLKYSRGDELESDSYGLKYMADSGYDPAEMIQVMRILKEATGSRGGSAMLQTHPDPDARIEQIKQYLQQKYPNGPGNLSKGPPLR